MNFTDPAAIAAALLELAARIETAADGGPLPTEVSLEVGLHVNGWDKPADTDAVATVDRLAAALGVSAVERGATDLGLHYGTRYDATAEGADVKVFAFLTGRTVGPEVAA